MSNEKNSRPDSRDELDIEQLIHSIRSASVQEEPSPQQERKRNSAAPAAPEPAVRPSVPPEQAAEPEPIPEVHLPEPSPAQAREAREARDALDPGVQQMRRQIQSLMAGWDTEMPEQSAETPEIPSAAPRAPEKAPEKAPEQPTIHWQFPTFAPQQEEQAAPRQQPERAEPEQPLEPSPLPEPEPPAPEQAAQPTPSMTEARPESPAEPETKKRRSPLRFPFFHRSKKQNRSEAELAAEPNPLAAAPVSAPISPEQPEPAEPPAPPASVPEPEPDSPAEPSRPPLSETIPAEPAPSQPPENTPPELRSPASEPDPSAFAAGEVITLRLHRNVTPAAPQEQQIFDQDEEVELERMLADHARAVTEQAEAERKAAEQAEVERKAAEQAEAERKAAEQAEAERKAAEQAEAERRAAEQAEAERKAAEQAEAERKAAEQAEAERQAAKLAELERRAGSVQVITVQLRQPGSPSAPVKAELFDQEHAQTERPTPRPRAKAEEPELSLEQEAMEEQITLPKLDYVPVLLRTGPKDTSADAPQPDEPDPDMDSPLPQPEPEPESAAEQPPIGSPARFEAEGEDAELESMLSAHAGPAKPVGRHPLSVSGVTVAAAEPSEDGQPFSAEPDAPTRRIPTPAPTDAPEAPDDVPEEDEEEGVADESLLQRPERTPGLLRQAALFFASLLQRSPRQAEEDAEDAEDTKGTEPPVEAESVPELPPEPKQHKPQRSAAAKKPASKRAPTPEHEAENVIEMPHEQPSLLQKKWTEMTERANDFADSMFQGDSPEAAEEEALHQKAERYIPGTDEEREPPRRRKPRPEPKQKDPVRRAPDTSPKELSRIFHGSWKSGKSRLPFQLLLAAALIVLGSIASGDISQISVPALTENLRLSGILLTIGLAGACVLGLDTLLEGIFQLFRGRAGLNTLSSIGVLLTLVDGLWYSLFTREGPLPFCGFAALSLWAVAWGNCRKKQGLYLSCQMAAAVSHPQRLTQDQGKWDNKGTFIKEAGTAKGFGSQIQEPDGAERVYRYAAPVMMLACFAFGILAAVGQQTPQHLIWNWSVIFVLAAPLSATLAYGIPYTKLVKRLNRSGVILAGWDGADSMKGEAGIAITDSDLFPEGYIQFNGIKNFGQVSLEKLTGCTASMIREMDSGLATLFDDQIRTQGGFYRRVDDLQAAEGGYSGLIRGDRVLVGCADYMKLMGISLQQGYQVRNAVFCVINGQLQGIFALNYSLPTSVKPALNALIHGGVNPILATRDFNITPVMLHQRFHLPTERMEYPPVDRRQLLSARGQPHNRTLGALIYREGLNACTDAILGGRRLRTVVRLNTVLAVAASVVGALLGFYLTMMGAYYSLSPLNMLFFLLMWLIPTLLISNGVDKF